MEKLTFTCCQQGPQKAQGEREAKAPATVAFPKAPSVDTESSRKTAQKPWTVFEGVYWI